MRTTKKELRQHIDCLTDDYDGLKKKIKILDDLRQSMSNQYQSEFQKLTKNITELEKNNAELKDRLAKLEFKVENPAKHKVGDIVKTKIVTKVEIVNTADMFYNARPNMFPLEWFSGKSICEYSWQYSVTDTKSGETSTFTE